MIMVFALAYKGNTDWGCNEYLTCCIDYKSIEKMSALCHRNCSLPRTTAKVQKAVCWSKPWDNALIEYLIWWFVISITVTKRKSNHPDVSQQSHWQPWCWLHSGPVRGFKKCASQTMKICSCHITMIGWLYIRGSGPGSLRFKFEAKQKVSPT